MLQKAILRGQYLLNDGYNAYFMRTRGIKDSAFVPVNELRTGSENLPYAQAYATVWLRNIDRLIAAARIDPAQFDFLDVGCGKGVAALYARDRFKFARVGGFDFDDHLVATARRNLVLSSVKGEIDFFAGDAAEIRLPARRTFYFLFNPFGAAVLQRFVDNNLETLRSTGSVIGYANCREMQVFDGIEGVTVNHVKGHRCAALTFRPREYTNQTSRAIGELVTD